MFNMFNMFSMFSMFNMFKIKYEAILCSSMQFRCFVDSSYNLGPSVWPLGEIPSRLLDHSICHRS